jgi:hypothetical protein
LAKWIERSPESRPHRLGFAGSFGLVQRGVGAFDELVRALPLSVVNSGHARAHGDKLVVGQLLAEVGYGDADALGRFCPCVRSGVWHDDGELFAAIAGGEVAVPDGLLEFGGDALQAPVARVVTVGVVVSLEMIDVDHGQA